MTYKIFLVDDYKEDKHRKSKTQDNSILEVITR